MNSTFCSLKTYQVFVFLLCLWGNSFLFPSQVRPLWLSLWRILWGPLFCGPLPSACLPWGPALIKSRPSSVGPSTLWGTTSQRNKSSRRAWRHLSSLTGKDSWDFTGVVEFSWFVTCFAIEGTTHNIPQGSRPIIQCLAYPTPVRIVTWSSIHPSIHQSPFNPPSIICSQILAQHSSLCHCHSSEWSGVQPSSRGFGGLPLAQWPAPAQPGGLAHPGPWGEEEEAEGQRSRKDWRGARAGPQPAFQTQVRYFESTCP